MSTIHFPNLTSKVHMTIANAGSAALSTAEIADRAGVPTGDGGFARSLVWRELDMLARRGEVERIKRPESRFVYWRRPAADTGLLQCPHLPACPPAGAPDCFAARVVADHSEQDWALLCNGLVIFDHEPLTARRIQRRRTAGWRMPRGAVYVGRPTKFGNPFPVAQHGLAGAVAAYRLWLESQPELVAQIRAELARRDLACWCAPAQPCHADVLLQIARSAGPVTVSGASR